MKLEVSFSINNISGITINSINDNGKIGFMLSEPDYNRILAISLFMSDNMMDTTAILMEGMTVTGLHIDDPVFIKTKKCRITGTSTDKCINFDLTLSDGSTIVTEIVPISILSKHKLPTKEYIIYTDGSCLGNPGSGGAAAIVVSDGKITKKSVSSYRITTNNRMELMAAIKGISLIPRGDTATLFSDSSYVINTVMKGWKRKKNKDLWELLDLELIDRNIIFKWIKGHNGNKFNERVDAMAKKAADINNNVDVAIDKGYEKYIL